MSESSRISRFVRAARSLLLMQLAGAVIALVLAVWAVTAVWELAAERDRLQAQVQALQSRQPAGTAEPTPAASSPLANEVRPPAILPIAIPVPEVAPDVNMIVPEANVAAPAPDLTTPPADVTPPGQDCSGANAGQPRCRPGRWNQPVRQRPVPRTQPDPQPSAPDTPSRENQA